MAFSGRKRRMETVLSYRGKRVSREDVEFIGSLIAQNPGDSRRKLSVKLCQAWNWVQANGEPRDMVCRSLMLELERAGFIELPPKKSNPPNPLVVRRKPEPALIDQSPIEGTLRGLPGAVIRQVRRGPFEKLFGGLIEQHHYLGYCQPVGEHLKYLVTMDERPIACFSWSSAPRHIGCRDRFIGWSPADSQEKHPPDSLQLQVPPLALGVHSASRLTSFGEKLQEGYLGIGRSSMVIPSICWRPSSIPNASRGPATGLPTGYTWGKPRDGA